MIYKIGEYYIDWKDTNFPLINDQFYDQFLVNEIKDNNKIISIQTKYLDLENIVKDLESGNIPLEEAITKYTDAMNLVKLCQEKLDKATKQVNKILDENGELVDFQVEQEG